MAVSTDSTTRLGCGRDIDDVWASIDQPPSPHERTCPFCQQARASLSRLARVIDAQRRADAASPDQQPGPQVLTRVMEIARAEIRRGRRLPLDEPADDGAVSDLSVSEQTVAAVVRRAGDTVPGVEVRRCRVELGDPRVSPVGPDEGAGPHDDSAPVGTGSEPVGTGSAPVGTGSGPVVTGSEPVETESVPDGTDLEDVPASYRATRPARLSIALQISVSATVAIPVAGQLIRQAVRRAVSEEVGMNVVIVDIDVRDIHDA